MLIVYIFLLVKIILKMNQLAVPNVDVLFHQLSINPQQQILAGDVTKSHALETVKFSAVISPAPFPVKNAFSLLVVVG